MLYCYWKVVFVVCIWIFLVYFHISERSVQLFLHYCCFTGQLLTLESLFSLMSNTKIVKEALTKGSPIYLLDLFANATNPNVREKTAELMAKMLSDKLVGPKVRIILSKFLPSIFMDAMRDSPEASVHMFEGRDPDMLIQWNPSNSTCTGRDILCQNRQCKTHRILSLGC